MHHYEQDVPFEVPKGWVWTVVSEITTSILYGISESAKNIGKYKLLRITDIQENHVNWNCVPFTDYEEEKAKSYLLKDGDIVFARTGATVGKSYLVEEINQETLYASYLIRVQSSENILTKYVKLFFESGYYWEQIELNSVGIGQPNVNGTILGNLNIPLPPFAEQQRIVAEIERWFALIDAIEQGKENLETSIKQAKGKILDLAIHGKLVPQDPSDEPASELLKRINPKAQIPCDNEHYAQLPKGWSIISMQDICKLKDGIKQDNIPLINLDVKYLRGTSAGKVIDSGKFVTANSYMILVDGENSGEVFKTSIDGYQGSTFKLLDIDQNVNEEYILNVINLHRKALRENKVGSAIPHLNKKLFKAISVPLPPYNEQIRIVEAIKSIFNILDALKENL